MAVLTQVPRIALHNDVISSVSYTHLDVYKRQHMRMEDNRIPTKVLFNQIEGRRPVRRPKTRWIDAVARDADNLLKIK